MKKLLLTLLLALSFIPGLGAEMLSRLSDVKVYPQPEPDRIMVSIEGSSMDEKDSLFVLCKGKIGETALNQGKIGFYIYNQDVQSREVQEPYTDSEGKQRFTKKTFYTVKMYALLASEPLSGMTDMIDAKVAMDAGNEKNETNSTITCVGSAVGCAVGVGVLIYYLVANPK